MSWGGWLRPRDAKGRESRTLFFVSVGFAVVTIRFALGGLGASLGDFRIEIAPTTPMLDYGAAVATILAVWLGREWINKRGGSDV